MAADFRVSLGRAKKVSAAYTRTGSMARPAYRPGRKPRIGAAEQALLRQWLEEQPDLTLAELQVRLCQQAQVQIHASCLCRWLKRMGQRLKKSLHVAERDTAENLIRRQQFLTAIAEVEPEHLVYLYPADEDLSVLDRPIEPDTRGDPETPLRWICKGCK